MNANETMAHTGGVDSMIFGFMGGTFTFLASDPTPMLGSIAGAAGVAILLSFASFIGKSAGVVVWKHTTKKYKAYKTKKQVK